MHATVAKGANYCKHDVALSIFVAPPLLGVSVLEGEGATSLDLS